MPHATKSALQDARDAFVAGLARRADALRPVVESFIADPSARVVRAELQRRLHSLLASAQLFEEPALVAQLQHLTGRLDAVGLASEAWQTPDSDLLLQLLSSLDPQASRTQVSGVPPAVFAARATIGEPRRASEPPVRSGRAPAPMSAPLPANETSTRNEKLPPPAPVVPTQQVGAVMLERVLMVCSRPHAAELRSLLDEAPLELLHAADPEQALTFVERCAPSYALVAAEFATLPDIDLVGRLRHHPQHPVAGVYLMLPNGATYDADFVRQTGADGVLIEPISWEMLGPLLDPPGFDLDDTTEPSEKLSLDGGLSEAFARAQSAADHAHRQLIESARVPKVKAKPIEAPAALEPPPPAPAPAPAPRPPAVPSGAFEARPTAAASGSPEASPVAGAQPTAASAVVEKPAERTRSLVGRRILVVDDDLAMLWFFSGVVRDAGAEALQARDGVEGLDTARRKRPQLVLSDILMPKLDGFGLRRALGSDLWLERTPVLLLSWKGDPAEDHEARPANASGLLRKEASVPEVLAAIERALAPRKRFEDALRSDGDVVGDVADLGIVALIECVVAARPDVRLTVEDAADVFDVDIADANQIAVTRTAADGTFTRAERALLQLIGVTQGRVHIRKRSGSLRSPVQTPLKSALHAAVSEISALIDAVSSERVEQVARLSFDEEVLASRLKDVPSFEPIVSSLRELALSPRQLLLDGKWSSGELSACLMVLARQGLITGVWGADGQDLLASSTRLYMPRPVPSLPPSLSHAPIVSAPAPVVAAPEPPAAEVTPEVAAAAEPNAPAASIEAAPAPSSTTEVVASEAAPVIPEPERATAKEPSPEVVEREEAPIASEPHASVAAVEAFPDDADERERTFESDPEAAFAHEGNPALVAEIAHARRRRRETLLLGATLVASAVLGYVGALQIETHPVLFGRSTQVIGTRGVDQPLMAANPSSETSVRSGLDPSYALGTVLPYIDTTRGVPVGSDEGLVIFEYVGPLPTPNVEIDGRLLGAPPLSVALAATPHQLKLWFAGEPTLRTLSVRAGETRVITLPLSKP